MGPSEPAYSPQPQPQPFNARPQSIHTLNSGNPQELGTGGYESPIDNRHSYPPAQQAYPDPKVYPQQAPIQRLPIRQRTASFDSPSSAYSAPQDTAYPGGPPQQGYASNAQQSSQHAPQHPPPGVPPQQQAQAPAQGMGANPYPALNSGPPSGGYQAYNPGQGPPPQQAPQAPYANSEKGGDDASDYYR